MFKKVCYTFVLLILDIVFWGTIWFLLLSLIQAIEGNNTWDFYHWLAGLVLYSILDGLRAKVKETYLFVKETLKHNKEARDV